MKKIIIFQILLLILGKYFLSDVSVKLPVKILQSFLPQEISLQELHFIKGKLILKNLSVKTKYGDIFCKKASILSYFPELLVKFDGATLQNPQANIFNGRGILGKRGRFYRSIITANGSPIAKINFVCDKLFLGKSSLQIPKSFQLPTFSLQQLDIHCGTQKQIFAHLSELKTEDFSIADLTLNSLHKRNVYANQFHLSTFTYGDIETHDAYGFFQLKKDFKELKHVVFFTKTDYSDIKNIAILCKAPKISKKKFRPKLYVENEALKASITFHDFFKYNVKNSHGYIQESLLKKFIKSEKLSTALSLKDKVYFSVHSLKSSINVNFSTQNIFLKAEHLLRAQGNACVKNLNTISWHVNLYGDNTDPVLSGQYDRTKKQGYLSGRGYIKPDLTYQFEEYLPDWWHSFFQNFHYYKNYPYADFQVLFDVNKATAITFGNCYVHDCKYKSTYLEELNVTFGNQPGFCQLTIHNLKTSPKQKGKCQINWPYDKINPDIELWLFKGHGNFSMKKWQNLLDDFIGCKDNFSSFDLFSPKSLAEVKFNGRIAHQKDTKEHLDLYFNMPQTKFSDIPVKQLQFSYFWTPKQISIRDIKGSFWNNSPVVAQVDLAQKKFNFSLKGETLGSRKILAHPYFKSWKEAIPAENLESYDGIFDLEAEGQGELSQELHLSGKGHIDFKNENLSQIHLLGPLSKLFSNRFKWRPNISFNQFISDFTFTENSISSDKSVLLGPSTRADIHGNLDLEKQAIAAKIHFSFLDYNQIQFPIMKHVVQIFQPLSKGFSASVSGTFKKPQWYLTFNPFRFVFKGK